MVLQKQSVDVSLATGIDTKTDSKLVSGKLLELRNAEVKNGIIAKSSGYKSLAPNETVKSSPNTTKVVMTSISGGLQSIDNNQLNIYDPLEDRMNVANAAYCVGRATYDVDGNIRFDDLLPEYQSSAGAIHASAPLDTSEYAMGQYGDYIVTAHPISTSLGYSNLGPFVRAHSIKVVRRSTNTVITNFSPVKQINTSTLSPRIQNITCTDSGYVVHSLWYFANYRNVIMIDYYQYGSTVPYVSYQSNDSDLGNTPPCPRPDYAGDVIPYAYFPFARAIFANNNIYSVQLRKNGATAGDYFIDIYVRDSFFGTLKSSILGDMSISMPSAGNKLDVDAASGFGLSHMVINGVSTICVFYGAMQFNLYTGIDTLTKTKTVLAEAGSATKMQTFDCAYIASTNKIALLRHQFREQYSLDGQYVIPIQNPPCITFYNLTTNAWEYPLKATSPGQVDVTPSSYFMNDTFPGINQDPGSGFLASGIFLVNDVPCFAITYFPYIYRINGLNYKQTTNTPHNERKASIILVDYNYNVIDRPLDFTAGLNGISNWQNGQSRYDKLNLISYPLMLMRNSAAKTNTVYSIPVMITGSNFSTYNDPKYSYALKIAEYSTKSDKPIKVLPIGNSTQVITPMMTTIDGNYSAEQNHHSYPQIGLATNQSGITTEMDLTKVYQYSVVYTWTTSSGDIVRSAPSIIKTSTATTGYGGIYVQLTRPPYFSKRLNGAIEIYRSKGNSNALFLLATINQRPFATTLSNTLGSAYRYFPWDAYGVFYFYGVFYDNVPDANLIGPAIYTSGNVLPDLPFPSSSSMTLHNNRIFAVPFLQKNTIQYSKYYQPTVGLATFPGLTINVEARGGDIVELASLDDKLIIFKKDFIYYLQGDGADNTGAGTSFSPVTLVNSPVGCSEPGSVVRIPDGIMFKSPKGIYLLNRSLQVSYIGADVEKYNSNTVTSTAILSNQNKVKFSTKEGNLIVYDYYYRTWSIEDNLPILSSTVYNGNYVGILSSGKIYQNDPTIYTRDGATYQMYIKTSWMNIAGLQGFQRVYQFLFLGDFQANHDMNATVVYDYDDTTADTHVLSTTDSFTPSVPYQFRVYFSRQKCESVQLILTDTPTTAAGSSFTITGLSFQVGVKSGQNKLPYSRNSSL